jgi:hypothetical protein
MQFTDKGRIVKLQGLQPQPLELHSISTHKVFKSVKGNDVRAFVLLDYVPPPPILTTEDTTSPP